MQAPPTNHITTTMQPRPSHGGFPGKLRTLSLFPLLFAPARNTHPAIPMLLGPINQIAITTGPRPTHGGYPPTALHQPANNHPQTNNSTSTRRQTKEGDDPQQERRRLALVHGMRVGEIRSVEQGELWKRRANQESRQRGWGVPGGMACSEGTSGCWHPQCNQALATARHIICGHCAAHRQQRQALLLDLRKAVADVKTALRFAAMDAAPKRQIIPNHGSHQHLPSLYRSSARTAGARLATIGTDRNR